MTLLHDISEKHGFKKLGFMGIRPDDFIWAYTPRDNPEEIWLTNLYAFDILGILNDGDACWEALNGVNPKLEEKNIEMVVLHEKYHHKPNILERIETLKKQYAEEANSEIKKLQELNAEQYTEDVRKFYLEKINNLEHAKESQANLGAISKWNENPLKYVMSHLINLYLNLLIVGNLDKQTLRSHVSEVLDAYYNWLRPDIKSKLEARIEKFDDEVRGLYEANAMQYLPEIIPYCMKFD